MQLTRNQQDALNIENHVCVTAGAGSGKTTVLVERYLKILRESNVTPREIVAITFTEKAAAEMKDRVIKRLSEEEDADTRENFLEQMNSAHISTIHAFCSSILREFPFQADVPANFSIVSGIDQKLLLQETLKNTLKGIATNIEHPNRPELTRLLQRYGGQKKLAEFFSMMIDQRDVVAKLNQDIYSEPIERKICETWERYIADEWIRCLAPLLAVAKGKNAEEVRELTNQLVQSRETEMAQSITREIRKKIAALITTAGGSIAKTDFLGRGVYTPEIDPEINFLEPAAKAAKALPPLEADTGEIDDNFLIRTTRDLLTLYDRILDDYQTTKLAQGKLDQSDLQLKTRDLLRNNKQIRQKLVDRYKFYMIDEYQDTNELQYELAMLLTNELKSANLFIVGDPKQGIYGFRGADVRVFNKTQKKIIENGGFKVSLKENFRSLRDPLRFVNYFFDQLMGEGSGNEFEVPYENLIQARQSNTGGNVDIILGKKDDETANEYTLIAQHIKNLKANSISVEEHGTKRSESLPPIAYGDIAILIRYRTHLPNIEHALLEAGIPYLTTKGVGFYQRQEIYDIWNYLNFLNAPTENDVSLAAVLRSPAFGISDAELYEISLQEGTNFWEKAQDYQTHSEHLKRAIHTLKKHSPLAHRMPVNQLIVSIVNETGLIGTLKTGIYGQQRSANYQKLLELARNFDGDENTQILPDFIEFLDTLIKEEPREGEAIIEESRGAVQIMTIHAAKGKEFPIVILPNLDRKGRPNSEPFIDDPLGIGFSPLNPDNDYQKTAPDIVTLIKNRADEKETAEKKRLFYVGTTRAEDRLILSGTLSEKGEAQQMLKWLDTHLDLCGPEDDLPSLPFKLNVLRQLKDRTPTDEILDDITPIDFSEWLPSTLEPTSIPAAFSVTELANYARCPLRYQLENVLRIPTNGKGEADPDTDKLDNAVRDTLRRIRRQSDTDNLDTIINQTAENYSEVTSNLTTLLHTSANNFINSQLGETALSASEIRTNQQVHADIEGHIIDGRFDRLFKDETQHWQVINYKTDDAQDSDVYDPEMELYSLLLHRRYPQQPTITINLFFTQQNQCIQKHFSIAELQDVSAQWKEKISELQRGNYNKNLDHCCSCSYADPDGQCIITQGEER